MLSLRWKNPPWEDADLSIPSLIIERTAVKRKELGAYVAIFVIFGLAGLLRFSEDVANVKILGLFGSGMAAGAALAMIITTLRRRKNGEQS
jgi:hypothetical protein